MRKIFFLLLLLVGSLQGLAQEYDEHREQIKALKTAYITKGLALTPEEAEKFWPIYNEFEQKRRELYKRERRDIGDVNCISEAHAEKMLAEYLEIEKKDYLLQKKFFADLRKFFSAHRIIELKKVEDEFTRKLFKEYRERHARKNGT